MVLIFSIVDTAHCSILSDLYCSFFAKSKAVAPKSKGVLVGEFVTGSKKYPYTNRTYLESVDNVVTRVVIEYGKNGKQEEFVVDFVLEFPGPVKLRGIHYEPTSVNYRVIYPVPERWNEILDENLGKKFPVRFAYADHVSERGEYTNLDSLTSLGREGKHLISPPQYRLSAHDFDSHATGATFIPSDVFESFRYKINFLLDLREQILEMPSSSQKETLLHLINQRVDDLGNHWEDSNILLFDIVRNKYIKKAAVNSIRDKIIELAKPSYYVLDSGYVRTSNSSLTSFANDFILRKDSPQELKELVSSMLPSYLNDGRAAELSNMMIDNAANSVYQEIGSP